MTEFRTLLSNFVKKSQINGLLKNDGTVDTTSYISTSNTQGLLKNDGTVDTTNYLSTHQDITGKEDKSNKVTNISSSSTDTEYPSAKCVYDGIREFINTIYPVGSIYISANEVSPTTLFGGTWVKIQDRFLLGASDTYANESTGGEATHTLTTNEMPSHTHTQNSHTHTQNSHTHSPTGSRKYIAVANGDNWGYTSKMKIGTGSSGTAYYYPHSDNNNDGITEQNATTSATPTINGQIATNQNTGGGQAHNNMPPYFSVDIWKKISNNSPFFIDKGVRDSYDTSNFGDIVQIESSSSALKGHLYNASINIDAYEFDSTGTGTKFFPITALNGKSRIRLVMELYVPSSSIVNTVFGFGVATTQNDAIVCNFSRSATVHTDYFNNGTYENTINLISNVPNDEWYYCEMIVDNDIVTMNVYNNDNVTVIFTDTITLSEYSNSYSTLTNRRYGIAIGYADGSKGYVRNIEATEL